MFNLVIIKKMNNTWERQGSGEGIPFKFLEGFNEKQLPKAN